jgi:predicted  nucleic acid-binding Zn-ribbon protein
MKDIDEEMKCQECGYKCSAEQAGDFVYENEGCPNCGGVDFDYNDEDDNDLPEPCSCEQSLSLLDVLVNIKTHLEHHRSDQALELTKMTIDMWEKATDKYRRENS